MNCGFCTELLTSGSYEREWNWTHGTHKTYELVALVNVSNLVTWDVINTVSGLYYSNDKLNINLLISPEKIFEFLCLEITLNCLVGPRGSKLPLVYPFPVSARHKSSSSSRLFLETSLRSERLCINYGRNFSNLLKVSLSTSTMTQSSKVSIIHDLLKVSKLTIIFDLLKVFKMKVWDYLYLLRCYEHLIWGPGTPPLKDSIGHSIVIFITPVTVRCYSYQESTRCE